MPEQTTTKTVTLIFDVPKKNEGKFEVDWNSYVNGDLTLAKFLSTWSKFMVESMMR